MIHGYDLGRTNCQMANCVRSMAQWYRTASSFVFNSANCKGYCADIKRRRRAKLAIYLRVFFFLFSCRRLVISSLSLCPLLFWSDIDIVIDLPDSVHASSHTCPERIQERNRRVQAHQLDRSITARERVASGWLSVFHGRMVNQEIGGKGKRPCRADGKVSASRKKKRKSRVTSDQSPGAKFRSICSSSPRKIAFAY